MTDSVEFVAAAQIISGLITLVIGGESLVRGASALALRLHVSPLVIGLTVVAFGTSSPELAVSLKASLTGSVEIAIGNAVGSNIMNVLFILGIAALVAPLVVQSQLIRWDVPLMITASVMLFAITLDGSLSRLDGLLLSGVLAVYLLWTLRQSARATVAVKEEFAYEVQRETAFARGRLFRQLFLVACGLAALYFGSNWLVTGSVTVARLAGVSELVIGLTIVALGTSLPEAVTSVIASTRGETDIAVGNIVGSNIFNIGAVLGVSAVVSPVELPVSPQAIAFDIPVMVVVAVACLPVFFSGNVIARWEGALFFGYFVVYAALVLMRATDNDLRHTVMEALLVFVIPLTVITLLVSVIRSWRRRGEHSEGGS